MISCVELSADIQCMIHTTTIVHVHKAKVKYQYMKGACVAMWLRPNTANLGLLPNTHFKC